MKLTKMLLCLVAALLTSCSTEMATAWNQTKDMVSRAEFKSSMSYEKDGWVCVKFCGRLRPGEEVPQEAVASSK